MVVVAQHRLHGHRLDRGYGPQVEQKDHLPLTVGAQQGLGRLYCKGGNKTGDIALSAHIDPILMIQSQEVVSKEGKIAFAVVVNVRGGAGKIVAHRCEITGERRGESYLNGGIGIVAEHLWHQIGTDLAVDYQPYILHGRPTHAVGRRIILKAHDDPIH